MSFKTLVVYKKDTGKILVAFTPTSTPDGKDIPPEKYPGWIDPAIHGVIHDQRRPELHEPGALRAYRVELVNGQPQIVPVPVEDDEEDSD